MSKIKLTIVILWSLLNTQALKAQDEDKTVTLVVSGQGKTQDEAKQNALRSAIEQAFGAFISSKTEILNDNLVKDEIVSLTNGNIKSFEILSSAELIEIGFVVTLNAQVSLNKIVSFVQNKGFSEVSFNGGGFAMNLKLQRLNEASELNAILNLCEQGLAINKRFIDYELEVGNTELVETSKLDAYTSKGWECDKSKNIKIPLNVKMKKNENRFIFDQYFIETLTAISMSDNEIESYKSINKKVHIINIMNPKNNMYEHESVLYFRNFKSIDYIKSFVFISNLLPLFNFKIDFDLGQFGISKTINDSMFYYKGNLFDDGSKYQKSYCEFNHWKLNFKKHLSEGIEENPASLFSTVNHLQKNYNNTAFEKPTESHFIYMYYIQLLNNISELSDPKLRTGNANDWKGGISKIDYYHSHYMDSIYSENSYNKIVNTYSYLKTYYNSSYFENDETFSNVLYYIKPVKSSKDIEMKIKLTFSEAELEKINGFKIRILE